MCAAKIGTIVVVVVISGAEKSGKSTLIEAIRTSVVLGDHPTKVRKWGKLDDGRWAVDQVYAEALIEDSAYPGLVLWDRSWASEAVYGKLLGRPRRLAEDPWLGEWLYGRGVPLKYILGGPDPFILKSARTEDDLPVDPIEEKAAFIAYGRQYGWHIIGSTDRERLPLETLVRLLRSSIMNSHGQFDDPRAYCGPPRASVVFVGERGSNHPTPGGWLSFSSKYTTHYGRILGDTAFRVGWTNAWDDRQGIFQHARLVIACGATAYQWAKEVQEKRGLGGTKVEQVPHPSHLYRWGKMSSSIGPTEDLIRGLVQQYT